MNGNDENNFDICCQLVISKWKQDIKDHEGVPPTEVDWNDECDTSGGMKTFFRKP